MKSTAKRRKLRFESMIIEKLDNPKPSLERSRFRFSHLMAGIQSLDSEHWSSIPFTNEVRWHHARTVIFPMLRSLSIGLIFSGMALIPLPLKAQEPPTKAFEQGNIPLSKIVDEWRRNGNNADIYICACDQEICDTRPGWPFRSFRTGESIPALGEANLNSARREGFLCGLHQSGS